MKPTLIDKTIMTLAIVLVVVVGSIYYFHKDEIVTTQACNTYHLHVIHTDNGWKCINSNGEISNPVLFITR